MLWPYSGFINQGPYESFILNKRYYDPHNWTSTGVGKGLRLSVVSSYVVYSDVYQESTMWSNFSSVKQLLLLAQCLQPISVHIFFICFIYISLILSQNIMLKTFGACRNYISFCIYNYLALTVIRTVSREPVLSVNK